MLEKKQRKQCILFSDHPTLPRWRMQACWFQREKPPTCFLQPTGSQAVSCILAELDALKVPQGLERNRYKRGTLANSKRAVDYSLLSRDLFLVVFHRLPKSPTIVQPKLEITCIISYFPFRIRDTTEDMQQQNPKYSMHGIFTYMYHRFKPNVGRYSIHGEFGNVMLQNVLGVLFSTSRLPSFSGIWSICTLDDSVIFHHRMLARGEGRRRGTEAFCKVFQEWGAECVLDGYGMCFVACLSRYV